MVLLQHCLAWLPSFWVPSTTLHKVALNTQANLLQQKVALIFSMSRKLKNLGYSNHFKLYIYSISRTQATPAFQPTTVPPFIFSISFYWYTAMGAVITIVVGLIISYCTLEDEKPVDRRLVSPVVRFLLPEQDKCAPDPGNRYNSVYGMLDKAALELTVHNETDKSD